MSWWELFKLKMQIHSQSENDREQAARKLGALGDTGAVEVLILALKDRGPAVRRSAAVALGLLKDARAVDHLLAALRDRNPAMRRSIITSLGQIKDARAIPTLITAIRDIDLDVRRLAGDSLVVIGPPAVEKLIPLLKDNEESIRRGVMGILGRINDPHAIEPLVALLHSGTVDRPAAAEALAKLGWKPLSAEERALFAFVRGKFDDPVAEGPAMVEPLLKLLQDPGPEVRHAAVRALGMIGDRRAVLPLTGMIQDDNPEVRDAVARSLGQLGDPAALEALSAMLEDEEPHVRPTALRALGLLKDDRAIPLLMAGLYDKKFAIHRAASEALAHLGAVAVLPLLDVLMASDAAVRHVAVETLGHIRDRRAVSPLAGVLKDPDPVVRREAARALGMIGDPHAADALASVLADAHEEVWIMAARALVQFGDPRALRPLLHCATKESIAASSVEGIKHIMTKHLASIPVADLEALATLTEIYQEYQQNAASLGQTVERKPVDCSPVNQVAREELARRKALV